MPEKIKKYYILFPFAIIYWIITSIRNKLFDANLLPEKEFDIPIISVGNITAGGTGKTPHIEYLIKTLHEKYTIATLSRGYKRKTKGYKLANNQSSALEIGDEPRQIKNKFPDIHVAVHSKRVAGIEKLQEGKNKLDTILLDDAFQHRYVKPGLSILLIDYNRLITRDAILPIGRLREPVYEMERANIIIITKCPADLKPIDKRILCKEINPYPFQELYFTCFKYGNIHTVFPTDSNTELSKSFNSEFHVLLITGIANPLPLKNYIQSSFPNISELIYPDHHNFTPKDITKIEDALHSVENNKKIIVTTEKDAIRFMSIKDIPESIKEKLFYIPVEVSFLFNQENDFNKHILNYVQNNKKYRDISSK